MTHICVVKLTIIGSDNGLSPGRRQAIIWTNAGILLIGPLGTNFIGILNGIQTFSFKKMHLKMSSAKWRPFGLGLNVVNIPSVRIFMGLHDAFHDVTASQAELMDFDLRRFVWPVFRHICAKVIYKNQTKIMILPKSYSYLHNLVLQAHLQVLLWTVADQQVPHDFDGITRSVLLFQSRHYNLWSKPTWTYRCDSMPVYSKGKEM